MPNDGGNFLLTADEKEALISEDSKITGVIRPFMGADEFINKVQKYCIWLDGFAPEKYRNIKAVQERIKRGAFPKTPRDSQDRPRMGIEKTRETL
jgi:hypothetical protein